MFLVPELVPVTVTVAVRLLLVVFLLAVMVMVALPEPLPCDTVHQDWPDLTSTFQVSLLVIVVVRDSPDGTNVSDVGLTVSV